MSSKIVIMEEEALAKLTKRIDKLSEQVEQLNTKNNSGFKERWLISEDVCKTLNISKRTLQELRTQKQISFSKIGRKIYYRASDIELFLESNFGE
jgi:excisionase family DNA binding protein